MNKEDKIIKLNSVILCFTAHPDNEPDSEFADRIDDLIDVVDSYNRPKLKDYIKKHHVNERRFSQESGISASLINYWCKKNRRFLRKSYMVFDNRIDCSNTWL